MSQSPGTVQTPRAAADAMQMIAQQMAKLKVPGLPRNYELFHEALFGHNNALSREVLALSQPPSQLQLDQIGVRHRLVGHCGIAAQKSVAEQARIVNDLADQLAQGIGQKQSFGRALDMITRSIREDESRGLDELLEELNFLHGSASNLVVSESALAVRLCESLAQLQAAEGTVKAAQATVLRDRLTNLANRIAFSNRLETLYGATPPTGTALIIADIDQFGEINRRYGEEAGNKLLKRLAAIFRKSIKKNDFVARTGGDEFAFLFADVTAEAARAIAERLHASVTDNLIFAAEDGSDGTALGLAIGFALSDAAGSPQQLLAHAELALSVARKNHRSPVAAYSPEIARHARYPAA
ncbi:MAG: GGDEF domain-containing protein [Allorhizobium sp.]